MRVDLRQPHNRCWTWQRTEKHYKHYALCMMWFWEQSNTFKYSNHSVCLVILFSFSSITWTWCQHLHKLFHLIFIILIRIHTGKENWGLGLPWLSSGWDITLPFQVACFDAWLGSQDLACCMEWQKKKMKRLKSLSNLPKIT